MQMKEHSLSTILAAVFTLNLVLLVLLAFDVNAISHNGWFLIGSCLVACLMAARAVRLSRELNTRLSRLAQIDRLISE